MSENGFSLIELMTVLAMVAVLSLFASLWSRDWVDNKQASSTVASFAAAVHLARQTAIVKNMPVTFCPRGVDGCGSRDTWHEGAIVFVDFNQNRRIDANDHLVKSIPSLKSGIRVYWRSFRNRSYLRFTATGLTDWQNGNFLICKTAAQHARQLILNSAGRMYFSRDSDGDGIHEDARGRAVSCG